MGRVPMVERVRLQGDVGPLPHPNDLSGLVVDFRGDLELLIIEVIPPPSFPVFACCAYQKKKDHRRTLVSS